jgi:hypothetical protein
MNTAQRIVALLFGALLLALMYPWFVAPQQRLVSIGALKYAETLALVSAPAVVVLLNIKRPNGMVVTTSMLAALAIFVLVVLDVPRALAFATNPSLAFSTIFIMASSPLSLAWLPGMAGLLAAILSKRGLAQAELAHSGSMNLVQRTAVIFVGATLAASLYLLLAAAPRGQVVSFHAAIYALGVGWLAIPAIASGLNISRPSVMTVVLSIVIVPPIGFYVFLMCLRLPGSEWMPSLVFNHIAFLHGLAGLTLATRLPRAVPLLLISCLCCFLAGAIIVHGATRWALQNQIERTLADGGCAISGMTKQRHVTTADDVDFGWIVGPRSEPVYLVYDLYYLRWSYSRFGLDTRGGVPKKYAPTDIALTQRYAQADKLSCD